MIITKNISINVNSSNLHHYESFGYKIPKYYHTHNGWCIKRNTFIDISVEHLPPKSSVKILCKCDKCGQEKLIHFYSLKRRNDSKYFCHKCCMSNLETLKRLSESHINPQISDQERKSNRNRHLLVGYKIWRKQIFQRDNYICQCCHIKNSKIQAHHIESWIQNKSKRTNIQNGITLCQKCHKKFHSEYGLKDFSLKELKEFLENYSLNITI